MTIFLRGCSLKLKNESILNNENQSHFNFKQCGVFINHRNTFLLALNKFNIQSCCDWIITDFNIPDHFQEQSFGDHSSVYINNAVIIYAPGIAF